MKKILAMITLGLFLGMGGCATTSSTSTPADINQTITTTLTSVGNVLAKIPATMDSLYEAKLITKEQYNQVADMYMKVKAAYITAVDAQIMNLAVGSADSQVRYDLAFQRLLILNVDLQQLLLSFGGK